VAARRRRLPRAAAQPARTLTVMVPIVLDLARYGPT